MRVKLQMSICQNDGVVITLLNADDICEELLTLDITAENLGRLLSQHSPAYGYVERINKDGFK